MNPLKKLMIVTALFAGGSSLAMAQNGLPTGGYPTVAGGAGGNPALIMSVQTPSEKTVQLRTMKIRGQMMILVPMYMACDVFHVSCQLRNCLCACWGRAA